MCVYLTHSTKRLRRSLLPFSFPFSNLIDPLLEKKKEYKKKGNILSHSHSLSSLSLFSSRADDDDAMACASCAEGKMKRERLESACVLERERERERGTNRIGRLSL